MRADRRRDRDDAVRPALAFGLDPELRTIDTPHGSVAFLQLVGITADEVTAMKATTTGDVLSRIATTNPLLITSDAR